jgi:hypothetical protein
MATYNGFNKALNRVVMRNVTEAQKANMVNNPVYKNLRFEAVPETIQEPIGMIKKVKAEPAPEKQEGAQDARP